MRKLVLAVLLATVGVHAGAFAAPTITSISPATGSTYGGTEVTIEGTGFDSSAVVTFGGVPGAKVAVVGSVHCTRLFF